MSAHPPNEHAIRPFLRRRWRLIAVAVVLATGLGAYALTSNNSEVPSPTAQLAAAPRPVTSPAEPFAPNGTFTTASGRIATIASLRGKPTMVWFVAGGCASCAASIPAVAAHLEQLHAAGLRVLTLGLYGDFPPGKKGVSTVLRFGADALGASIARLERATTASLRRFDVRPAWQWGMASKSLSLSYDPSGTPDLYVLIGPNGHIRYRNSVPVSTMGALITAAKRLDTHA